MRENGENSWHFAYRTMIIPAVRLEATGRSNLLGFEILSLIVFQLNPGDNLGDFLKFHITTCT
jgi:hypothetical protein